LTCQRSIRILKLKYSKEWHSDLYCDMLEASLGQPPQYEALSYSWDAQYPQIYIYCSWAIFPITANCETALRHLRSRRSRLLWVDSICIDQTSISEQNHQVRLMGDIYKTVQRVLVWLGEGTPGTQSHIQVCLHNSAHAITLVCHTITCLAER